MWNVQGVKQMSELDITCPSGLAGRIRGLKGRDFRNFNRQTAKTGEGLTRVLAACWVDTADPGIYSLGPSGQLNWDDILIGDRLFALVSIRRAMYPEKYAFKVTCQEMACRKPIEWQIDLADLPVKKLPTASALALREGRNEFPHTIASGQVVKFHLLTGKLQAAGQSKLQSLMRRYDRYDRPSDLILSLATRITHVDGVDAGNTGELVNWLEDLGAEEHRAMIRAFDAADCGIDTTIEIECQAGDCMATQAVELPFGRDFLMPR